MTRRWRITVALLALALPSFGSACKETGTKAGPEKGQAAKAASERPKVSVGKDGRLIVVRMGDMGAPRTVDVIGSCGAPAVGEPKVREVKVTGTLVQVVYGKHSFASVDPVTGKVTCKGSD